MKQFLKNNELALVNGGYLVNSNTNSPVGHKEFVALQHRAHYIATFAAAAKGKDLVGKKAVTLFDIKQEVADTLNKNKAIEFVSADPFTPGKITAALKSEALEFMSHGKDVSKAKKVNAFLQDFKLLAEFEEFGLFFNEDIVKLDRIYTMAEITDNVLEVIDLLG